MNGILPVGYLKNPILPRLPENCYHVGGSDMAIMYVLHFDLTFVVHLCVYILEGFA
jgi:hypothetical protein